MREVEKYKEIVDGMSKLFADKNADYGNTFDEMFQKYGTGYFTIMVSQKMSRVDGVLRSGKNNFESIEDSFRDAANYCVLALMCLDKAKDDGMQKYGDS